MRIFKGLCSVDGASINPMEQFAIDLSRLVLPILRQHGVVRAGP